MVVICMLLVLVIIADLTFPGSGVIFQSMHVVEALVEYIFGESVYQERRVLELSRIKRLYDASSIG